jgi:hypothetical protein
MTKCMEMLNKNRNQNFNSFSVKHKEYESLNNIYECLIQSVINRIYNLDRNKI